MTIANAVIDSDGFLNDDIMTCLNCLYSTVEGTQPLDVRCSGENRKV